LKRKIPHRYPQTTAAVTEDSSRNLSLSDIESILKQLAGTSGACAPTSQPIMIVLILPSVLVQVPLVLGSLILVATII